MIASINNSLKEKRYINKKKLQRTCFELNIDSNLTIEEIEKFAYNVHIVDDCIYSVVTELLDLIQEMKQWNEIK